MLVQRLLMLLGVLCVRTAVDAVVLVTNIQQVLHISSVLLPAVKRDLVELFHSSWWSGNFTMTWICCRSLIPIIEVTEAQFTRYCTGCSAFLLNVAFAAPPFYWILPLQWTNFTRYWACNRSILLDVVFAAPPFYWILHLQYGAVHLSTTTCVQPPNRQVDQ